MQNLGDGDECQIYEQHSKGMMSLLKDLTPVI